MSLLGSSGVMNPAALIVVEPLEGPCDRLCPPPDMCTASGGCYEATTAEARGTTLVEQMFPDKTTLAPHRCAKRKRRLQARLCADLVAIRTGRGGLGCGRS